MNVSPGNRPVTAQAQNAQAVARRLPVSAREPPVGGALARRGRRVAVRECCREALNALQARRRTQRRFVGWIAPGTWGSRTVPTPIYTVYFISSASLLPSSKIYPLSALSHPPPHTFHYQVIIVSSIHVIYKTIAFNKRNGFF